MSYRCAVCEEVHEGLPDIAWDRPDHWWGVPEEGRDRRIQLTSETCVIDDEDFFIRGVVEIPVHGEPDGFAFGVWVSQKRENFYKYVENPASGEIGPFFGWLCTRIDFYGEETLNLKTMAHFREGKQRPRIVLEETDHPLSVDQREGITLDRAWQIAHFYNAVDGDS